MLLALIVTATSIYAQSMPAQWLIYEKSYNGRWGAMYSSDMEKLVFTPTNYDVYVYSDQSITDEGEWQLKVTGYGGLSVVSTLIGVVPAEYPDSLILPMYNEGKITGLHRAEIDTTSIYNRADFNVEDGDWKPVVFGFDATGTLCSHNVGTTQTFSSDFSTKLNDNLILKDVTNSGLHHDWGYGSIMHIRDVMGDDYAVSGNLSGYDWYRSWEQNINMGSKYTYAQVVWKYFDTAIRQLDGLIATMEKRSKKTDLKASMGTAYAQKAMLYLDAARMYEFLPNERISSVNESGNDVAGLTYPIATSADSIVVRATRAEMVTHILSLLDKAEELLKVETRSASDVNNKLLANLNVVYGLKARLYLWTENYTKAAKYANDAVNLNLYPMLSREQWLDTLTGFNNRNASSWMWAMAYPEGSDLVISSILNWVSWCCNEYLSGYTRAGYPGQQPMMSKVMYDRMSDTDFRKLSYIAPEGTALYGQESTLNGRNNLVDYASLKFRPGKGEVSNYEVACVVDVPLMRTEEMYFIIMEAYAQMGQYEMARAYLNSLMTTRDPNYAYQFTNKTALLEEIMFQKRVELWGEGLNYFDDKRTNRSITRGYAGSNFASAAQFNTVGRPAWQNFVFVMNAYGGSIETWNNPDPSGCYEPASY